MNCAQLKAIELVSECERESAERAWKEARARESVNSMQYRAYDALHGDKNTNESQIFCRQLFLPSVKGVCLLFPN